MSPRGPGPALSLIHIYQHGTAIVVSAALKNALRLTGRRLADCRIVLNGPGAADVYKRQPLCGGRRGRSL